MAIEFARANRNTDFVVDVKTLILLLLPIAIILINFAIGLGQKWQNFARIKDNKTAVFFALGLQFICFPLLAVFLSWAFQLSPDFSIGMLLLASSPGSPAANLYSLLAKGDAALNVVLTGLNAVIAAFTIPLMVNVAYRLYYGAEKEIPLEPERLASLIALLLVPLMAGMFVNYKWPEWTAKYAARIGKIGWIYLLALVVMGVAKDHALVLRGFMAVGHTTLLLNLGALAASFWLSRAIKLNRAQSISIMMELGLHNVSMVLTLGVSPDLLNNIDIALPSAIYTFYMHLSANILIFRMRNK